MTKRSVILDVDTGVDDAMALMLAAANDTLDIRAVTTVFGNNPVERTTVNTRKVCGLLGLHDVPVAAGAWRPLIDEPIDYEAGMEIGIHGSDGLGGVGDALPEPTMPITGLTAPELMAQVVRDSTDKVTIVALAPLTNVATFLLAYPELHEKIDCIALMGGAVIGGNLRQSVEANIGHDPDAAAIVFMSGVKVIMFGLDATMGCYITDAERAQMKETGGEVGAFLCNCLQGYADIYRQLANWPGAVLHDSLPVAWLLDESVVTLEHRYVEIDLEGNLTRGCTVTDLDDILKKQPNTWIAMSADRDKLIRMHLDAVRRFA